jgi:hypothetical protein
MILPSELKYESTKREMIALLISNSKPLAIHDRSGTPVLLFTHSELLEYDGRETSSLA